MIRLTLILLLLPIVILTSCSSDDPDTSNQNCLLVDVNLKLDANSSLGIMSVAYNSDNTVSSAGLQEKIFTYDADGNIINSLLESTPFVPKVETTFTYENNRLTNAVQVWNDEIDNPRYIYDLTYDGNFLDKVEVTGTFAPSTLDFDFDENGNVLKYTDWVFEDVTNYTYDTSNKGIFASPLDHTKAIAYSIGTGDPFWFWNNALSSISEDGVTLSFETKFNAQGLMTEALSGDNDYDYLFDYMCE